MMMVEWGRRRNRRRRNGGGERERILERKWGVSCACVCLSVCPGRERKERERERERKERLFPGRCLRRFERARCLDFSRLDASIKRQSGPRRKTTSSRIFACLSSRKREEARYLSKS